ncbi:MAG: hypothetical protein GX083_00465 [Clostridiales bacterium]|nr:hypothetical protein [Clostridiales bacterium]
MNVYDEAHSLATAIKDSNEFKEFDRMRLEVEKDDEISKMLGDLQKLQLEVQTAQIQGEQIDPSVIGQIQSLGTMLSTKPNAAEYMKAEAAFSIMMNDVFQIIGEAVGMH